jgi:hypothetical protein
MSQPVLDFSVPVVLPEGSIAARFEKFRRENPEVERLLLTYAREFQARGYERCGIKFFFESVRYLERQKIQRDGSGYRLNNSYTALYARLLMERYPELAGFFETRERRAL